MQVLDQNGNVKTVQVTDVADAADIDFTPTGGISSTDVQAALAELDSEKATAANAVMDGDAAGGVLAGTYPSPSFASDMATQAELDAHINDSSDAHDASAISILDAGGDFTATDVEGALAELQADHEADVTALSDHIADATDAHAGSAITNTPAGGIAATTVQAAIDELDSEKQTAAQVTSAITGREYVTSIGNGTDTVFTVTHSLSTRDVMVQVYDNGTFEQLGSFACEHTSTSVVTITIPGPPTTNQYRVLVIKVG